MLSAVLLSTAYLPPVRYMCQFLRYEHVWIEKHENYQKQTYRNRCCIYGANGKQCLVIPVVKNHGEKTAITDVQIDYTMPWQKIHLKSIESAYRLSPFYEYYADDFTDLYNRQPLTLFDWNMTGLKKILELLPIKNVPQETDKWEPQLNSTDDFRNNIHPKKRLDQQIQGFNVYPYQQVFIEKHGFMADLSIMDLLFNEGPQACGILKKCISQ